MARPTSTGHGNSTTLRDRKRLDDRIRKHSSKTTRQGPHGRTPALPGNSKPFATTKELITARVNRRLAANATLARTTGARSSTTNSRQSARLPTRKQKSFARQEKARALEELFRSRFGVLNRSRRHRENQSPHRAHQDSRNRRRGKYSSSRQPARHAYNCRSGPRTHKRRRLRSFCSATNGTNPRTQTYRVSGSTNRERAYKTVIIDGMLDAHRRTTRRDHRRDRAHPASTGLSSSVIRGNSRPSAQDDHSWISSGT